jgi:mannose-6-phosphate isomerase-like protein (cupin superfamily)
MEIRKVNLLEAFTQITEYWDPHVVGELNGQQVKLAKIHGEFVPHKHDNEDELFLVLKGTLVITFEKKTITLNPGEFCVVPKGVVHQPIAKDEVEVLLFEPASTLNTGDQQNQFTKKKLKKL